MDLRLLCSITGLFAFLTATAAPAAAGVRSLTLGISTSCPYGGIAE